MFFHFLDLVDAGALATISTIGAVHTFKDRKLVKSTETWFHVAIIGVFAYGAVALVGSVFA